MCAAVVAQNFHPSAVRIRYFLYCTQYLIIKAWPAAAAFEFIFAFVQGCIAAPAYVSAFFFIIIVFTCKWPFCSFVQDHIFFLGCELVVFHILKMLYCYIDKLLLRSSLVGGRSSFVALHNISAIFLPIFSARRSVGTSF